jgi:hypothetical protein
MANRRRSKKKTLPARMGEEATMERRQHAGGVIAEVVDRDLRGNPYMKRDRAVAECVLDAYLFRRIITKREYEAGLKFRRAYLRAVFKVRVEDPLSTSAYDPEMALLIVPISEQVLRAAYAVLSKAQKRIVINVCGADDWAHGSARLATLHRALERLGDLWKL